MADLDSRNMLQCVIKDNCTRSICFVWSNNQHPIKFVMVIFNILLRRFNRLRNSRKESGPNLSLWNRRILSQPKCGDTSAGGLLTPVFPSPFVLVFQSSMQSLSLTLSAIPHGTIRPSDVRYGCEHWLITPMPPLSSLLLEVYSISILGKWATVCDSVY